LAIFALLLSVTFAQLNLADWGGTFSAVSRYGGQTFLCPKGTTLYGVFSNAGFLVGHITNRTATGTWYQGGRYDRNLLQGSFQITLNADNNGFDGYFTTAEDPDDAVRWREQRLGAPWPSNPSNEQCLVPDTTQSIVGTWFGGLVVHGSYADWSLCGDDYYNLYGSFNTPLGYLQGWEVNNWGLQGYLYGSDGLQGAVILVTISPQQALGFYWLGSPNNRNYPTSGQIVLNRATVESDPDSCQAVGPGLPLRLHNNDAGLLAVSPLLLALLALLALLL